MAVLRLELLPDVCVWVVLDWCVEVLLLVLLGEENPSFVASRLTELWCNGVVSEGVFENNIKCKSCMACVGLIGSPLLLVVRE